MADWRTGAAGLSALRGRIHGTIAARITVLRRRLPVLAGALEIARDTDLVDRAAALALFCMLTFVPAMFGLFSALGYVFDQLGQAAEVAGIQVTTAQGVIAQATRVIQEALPGVTWDPSALANALVRDRASNGVFSSVTALVLGLTLFARIDNAVRVIFGRHKRSTFRAAGIFGLFFVIGSLLALILSIAAPLTDWGLHVAAEGMSTLTLGWVDGFTLVVAGTQILPIILGFYGLVRWSAGRNRLSRTRLALTSLGFGALWFVGQRGFSLYVGEVIRMDAIYGALTGVVALMLWLYYAALAFLATVALLASWERVHNGTIAAESPGDAAVHEDAPT